VLQTCENPALLLHAFPDQSMVISALEQLNGDALLEFSVGSLRQIDQAHPTSSDDGKHAIRADSLAGSEHKILQGRG
jgi:hypothetical protein